MDNNNVAAEAQPTTAPGFEFLAHSREIVAISEACALEGEFEERLALGGWDLYAQRAADRALADGVDPIDIARAVLTVARRFVGKAALDRALFLLAETALDRGVVELTAENEVCLNTGDERHCVAWNVFGLASDARRGLPLDVQVLVHMEASPSGAGEGAATARAFAEALVAAFAELPRVPAAE